MIKKSVYPVDIMLDLGLEFESCVLDGGEPTAPAEALPWFNHSWLEPSNDRSLRRRALPSSFFRTNGKGVPTVCTPSTVFLPTGLSIVTKPRKRSRKIDHLGDIGAMEPLMEDGRYLTWEVWADSGNGGLDRRGEELWVFFSPAEAADRLPILCSENPALYNWRIEPHRREREFLELLHKVLSPEAG